MESWSTHGDGLQQSDLKGDKLVQHLWLLLRLGAHYTDTSAWSQSNRGEWCGRHWEEELGMWESRFIYASKVGVVGGQVSSVCLVCGSKRATSPPVSSRTDTSSTGTAQLVSTSFPKTMLAMIAATRPTPVKKPRAEDLRRKTRSSKRILQNRWVSVLGNCTAAVSGRALSPTRPENSSWWLTHHWRRRTGSSSGPGSGPHRWGRCSGWTRPGCRLQQRTPWEFESNGFCGNIKASLGVLKRWELYTAVGLTQKDFASCAVHQKDAEDVSGQVGQSDVETFLVDCRRSRHRKA